MDFDKIIKLAELFAEAAGCRKEYMRQYMAKRYHDKMNTLRQLLGGKCKMCGDKKGPFHIDHKDSKKKTMRAADVHSTADSKVKEEMKNFQLLCTKCHKKKTHDEWDYSVPKPRCGTYWMYRRHGCRCDSCCKAYKDKMKEYREMSKARREKEKEKMEDMIKMDKEINGKRNKKEDK